MSWSYDEALTQYRDQVRFLIGDTNEDDQQISDEEIDWTLDQQSNPYSAAALACRGLHSKYARKATKTVGDLSIQWAEIANNYRDLRKELEILATRHEGVPVPYAGGISKTDKDIEESDEDRVEPYFVTNQHSWAGTPVSNPRVLRLP